MDRGKRDGKRDGKRNGRGQWVLFGDKTFPGGAKEALRGPRFRMSMSTAPVLTTRSFCPSLLRGRSFLILRKDSASSF